ncbi:SusC/RagA family TonB-linked outer membrane protein [Sphingobacterium sp.]|uniref:SusC/RagA family TonB-linked outer membrane protein n=1 Tax=Sphingobacterium sp. TaxID=341027 RepID=UPI0028981E6F|nr:SusC/RagA family TonB-linked outer membrane protein [Sphingobacterium sp.]
MCLLFLGSSPLLVNAQEKRIKIIIKDEKTQEAIAGALVVNPLNSQSFVTDKQGIIYVPQATNEQAFMVSMLGYETKQLALDQQRSEWIINLVAQEKGLAEVVVTGYTKQSRLHTAGAVSTLDVKGIADLPVSSFDQSFQGQIPGLYVASPSGQPGAAGRVTLRGIGSLQDQNSSPLYILDGVPISEGSFSTLNPQNFENISVLKDAAATAQYGSRGANGVIVISSKKGSSWDDGRAKITYTGQYGFSQVNHQKWDMMDTAERLRFEEKLQDPNFPGWQYSRNNPNKIVDGVSVPKTTADFEQGDAKLAELGAINTDWRKLLLRNGKTNSHNISISAGKEKTQVFSSLSYFNQQGVLYNSGIERFNLTNNVNYQSNRFSAGLNVSLATSDTKISESDFDVSETNPVASLYFALPYEQPYDNMGKLTPGPNRFGSNALTQYQDVNRQERQYKSVIATNLSYALSDFFKITSTSGIDYQQINKKHIIKPDTYFGGLIEQGGQGSFTQGTNNYFSLVSNIGFNYQKKWQQHFIEIVGLGELNKQRFNNHSFTGFGLIPGLYDSPSGITPGTPENNLIPILTGGMSENALVSQIGLIRYSNANRFTFTASLRRDGSSRVPKNNRFKYFYAFGGSWNIGEEKMIKNIPQIYTARLRASYGQTGNAAGFANDFGYRRLYTVTQYAGHNAFIPQGPGNPAYNWEINRVTDVGLELGLFNNNLITEFNFYNRITSNLFVERSLSLTSGFEHIADNLGKIRNRGFEFKIAGNIIRNKELFVRIGINGAYNQNRILSLGEQEEIVTEDYSIHRVGHQLGHFYMVRWAGVDSQTGAPLYFDLAGNKTPEFDPEYAVLVKGSFDPPLKGGFTLDAGYKNLSINALFTYIRGMYRLNTGELYRTSADPNYRIYNQSRGMLDFWTKPGDTYANPAPEYQRFMTDRELQSADYIKLRSLQINYKIRSLTHSKNTPFRDINIFAQGQNLITWTKWKGQDPEDDNNWYQYEYPLPRTFTIGLNVKF